MPTAKHVPVLADDAVRSALTSDLPHWTLAEGTIQRVYRTSGWKSTMMAANAIGHLAEAAWHHPDLLLSYDRVEVRLSTHSEKGITAKDLALARKIEDVVAWRPGADPDGPLDGTPDEPRYRHIVT